MGADARRRDAIEDQLLQGHPPVRPLHPAAVALSEEGVSESGGAADRSERADAPRRALEGVPDEEPEGSRSGGRVHGELVQDLRDGAGRGGDAGERGSGRCCSADTLF